MATARKTILNSLEKLKEKGAEMNFKKSATGDVDSKQVDYQRRIVQMNLKEFWNLGVLNGPDLMLMDQVIYDPNSFTSNLKDNVVSGFFGAPGYSHEEQLSSNLDTIRDMLDKSMREAQENMVKEKKGEIDGSWRLENIQSLGAIDPAKLKEYGLTPEMINERLKVEASQKESLPDTGVEGVVRTK